MSLRTDTTVGSRSVLVTGAAGYVGSVLVGHLLTRGHRVAALDLLMYGGDALVPYLRHPRFRLHWGNIRDAATCEEALRGVDSVVHLAAIVGFPACSHRDADEVWDVNCGAAVRLFEQANRENVNRFIFASSYSNYGIAEAECLVTEAAALHPQSLYAETKVAAEAGILNLAQRLTTAPVLFRFATLFGLSPRMRFDLMLNQFVLEAHRFRRLVLFQPEVYRSFLHVFDAVRAITSAIETAGSCVEGEIFNVGSEDASMTKRQVAELVAQRIPGTVVEVEENGFDGDMRSIRLCCEKIRDRLSFATSISLEDGITEIAHALEVGYFSDPDSGYHRNATPLR